MSTSDACEHEICEGEYISPESATTQLAMGMYMTLWPKIEKCDGYVGMLLDTQECLQEKIEELMVLLDGGVEGNAESPLVKYASRLKQFPQRVLALQTKLEGIRMMLASLRKPRVVIQDPPPNSGLKSIEPVEEDDVADN
ncbi:hypothetical protein THRCLA_03688 [Thraustotheca clavata]|uniref:Biogenesis of lysosome-related organelles complex 1 subunit 7 n=1 Tax=Thraustotheca clavata TaxID=74557 RepID=A0A1W0A188_9STRA|nr:hypothetical protein THRCLA_03688 [Thraustotheca clavata]